MEFCYLFVFKDAGSVWDYVKIQNWNRDLDDEMSIRDAIFDAWYEIPYARRQAYCEHFSVEAEKDYATEKWYLNLMDNNGNTLTFFEVEIVPALEAPNGRFYRLEEFKA